MAFTPVVGDRYLFTYAELGRPLANGPVKVSGFGTILLDDADIHYAQKYSDQAAFYVRPSKALGDNMFVVVARMQPA